MDGERCERCKPEHGVTRPEKEPGTARSRECEKRPRACWEMAKTEQAALQMRGGVQSGLAATEPELIIGSICTALRF